MSPLPRPALPLVAALMLLAGCALEPYRSPTSGPMAQVYIEPDVRTDVLPMIHVDPDCGDAKELPVGQWVAVPANRSLGFRKNFPLGTTFCIAEGRIDVREGQRIRLNFVSVQSGLSMRCGLRAVEVVGAAGPDMRVPLPVAKNCTG